MSFDRRSFKYGVIAGLLLFAGVLVGVVLSARFDWISATTAETQTTQPAPSVGTMPPNFVDVVKAVMPAVVNISTSRVVHSGGQSPQSPLMDDPFFRQFFGEEFFRRFQIPRERKENSLGSGVIVDSSGYIVTNNHVIAKADEIKVLLTDKREFTGKVIGTDPKSDIAVVKIDASNLPTVFWADSDKLEVGEYALAIGNPFGLNQTVTMGIVSAVGRANVGIADYEDFIQTDAPINPGNSGGALVNARGELIGINTAIFSRSGGSMGVGFAVPSNMAQAVMTSLIKHGKVVRGWLGVSIQEITPELAKQFGLRDAKGALVSEVLPNSPAAKSGFKSGDVIVKFDGKQIESPAMLRNVVGQTAVSKSVKVEVFREKRSKTIRVKIGEQPKEVAQSQEAPAAGETRNNALAGIDVRTVTPDMARQLNLPAGTSGVVIGAVSPDSDAAQSGLKPGDVILEINRQAVRNLNDYKRIVQKLGEKESVLLLINRRGGKVFIVIKP